MVKKLYVTSSYQLLGTCLLNESDLEVGAGGVERHVPGGVVEGEVVLGQGGLARVEGGLVAQGVGAVTHSSGHVHNWAANIRSCKILLA